MPGSMVLMVYSLLLSCGLFNTVVSKSSLNAV